MCYRNISREFREPILNRPIAVFTIEIENVIVAAAAHYKMKSIFCKAYTILFEITGTDVNKLSNSLSKNVRAKYSKHSWPKSVFLRFTVNWNVPS